MSFPNLTLVQKQGNSGRPIQGQDHLSGMLFYGDAPSVSGKWATYAGSPSIKAQQLFSTADATSAGIIPYSDNTAATSTHTLVKGSTGDTITIYAAIPVVVSDTYPTGFKTVTLCTYAQVAGDSTDTLLAVSVKNAINALTYSTGFSATSALGVVTIIAPKSAGISLNTGTVYTKTIVGTMTDTIVQNVVAGTASNHALWYYQISEYFRIFPKGSNIWVGICAVADRSSFNEVVTLQRVAAKSTLRQIGITDISTTTGLAANISGSISTLQTAVETCFQDAPFEAVYSPNIAAVSDLSTLPDQNLNTAPRVQTVLSQDGGNDGAQLFIRNGISTGSMGVKLATIAISRVSASDAQAITAFSVSSGTENNIPAFANGQLLSAVSDSLQLQLNDRNYTFFRSWGDVVVGTFWNDNRTCVDNSSDYAYVNDNRTFQKVQRICRKTYVPLLSSEFIFNPNGTLSNSALASFTDAGNDALKAGLITNYGAFPEVGNNGDDFITIDPTQNVRSTNNLTLDCTIVQNGIARNITINIAYGTL